MSNKIRGWRYQGLVPVIVCLGLCCNNIDTNEPDGIADEAGALVVSDDRVDFGEVLPSETPAKTIRLTNQSGDAIDIKSVTSTSPCALVESDVRALGPGASAAIEIRLSVADYPSNEVDAQVNIVPESPEQDTIVVPVHASITPEYTVTPNRVEFGEFKPGTRLVQTIAIKQNGDTPIEISGFEMAGSFVVSYDQVSPQAAPGGEQDSKPSEWQFQVMPAPDLSPGPVDGRLTITTNVKRLPKIEVPISGRVLD